MKIRYAAASDRGRVRRNNEDAFLTDAGLGVFAVADGMGGHAAGEVASHLALETLRESFARQPGRRKDPESSDPAAVLSPAAHPLIDGIEQANRAVYQSSREQELLKGMGTTLVAVWISNSSPVVAHVGDSRLYRLRGRTIEQVTEDHSLVWEQYRQGLLPKEALSGSPLKNVVTRALGIRPEVEADLKPLDLQEGDLLILCSDGLSDLVEEEELKSAVQEAAGDLNRACESLIELANRRGGKDNITVILLRIEETGPSP